MPVPARTIGAIDVVAPPALSRPLLLDRLELKPGAPYQRDALNARIDQYVEGQRRKGYYEAKMAVSAQLADGDRVANLTLTVVTGPLVQVVFTGDALPVRDAARARARGERGIGGRGPAGGLDQPHRGVPPPAGVP